MRKINELIWHCTATPEGREVSAKEIDKWHKKRGWNGIGYHKVVHLDGSVSEGRPAWKIGAHVKGRNNGSLGYVYVGGVDKNMKAKDTRTESQKVTMRRLTYEAIKEYGVTKVSGHNQYAAKACPSFNAKREYADTLTGGKDPSLLSKSRTLAGASATGIGTAGTAITDAAQQLQPLAEISPYIKYTFIALTVIGALVMIYAKLDDAGFFTKEIEK